MATFCKNSSGTWRTQIRMHGISTSKSFKLKSDAQAWANEIEITAGALEKFQAVLIEQRLKPHRFIDTFETNLFDIEVRMKRLPTKFAPSEISRRQQTSGVLKMELNIDP